MLKSAMLLALTLCVGIGLGVSLSAFGQWIPWLHPLLKQASQIDATPDPSITESARFDRLGPEEASGISTSMPLASTEGLIKPLSTIAFLNQRLDEALVTQQQLASEVHELRETLTTVEQRLDELTKPEVAPENVAERSPPADASEGIDSAALIAAGFDQEEAVFLNERWGEQQMELLYLQDQATREGWLGTPQYAQSVRDLINGPDSMREEIGSEVYDRFLYGSGQSNRVVINSVINRSPAQAIGLQPGDMILSYDEQPVFSASDLGRAISSGEPGERIVLEIDRAGQRVDLEIARGPIGVMLGGKRVKP
jgi:PDZ domain